MKQRTKEEVEDWLRSKGFKNREDLKSFLNSKEDINEVDFALLDGDFVEGKTQVLWEKWVKAIPDTEQTNKQIKQEFNTLRDFVIQKNITYGNSLQNPIGVFQKEPLQGILGRIDDKLSRIKTVGINDETEDSISDLIGYFIHLKIMIKNEIHKS